MADIIIPFTVPDALVSEMIDVFGEAYQENISNPEYDPEDETSEETIPNPKSKAVFAKEEFKKVGIKAWRNEVRRYRTKKAGEALDNTFNIEA